MEVNSDYFQLLRPNYQLEHYITKKKKKNNYASGQIYLGSSLFSFYQGMVKMTMTMFLLKKNII